MHVKAASNTLEIHRKWQSSRISGLPGVQRLSKRKVPPGRGKRADLCVAEASTPFQEWDIVLYETPGGAQALGRVSQVDAREASVEPLEEDAANLVWLVSHTDEQRVLLSRIRRTVEADYLQIVDPDRVSNPHGEHALEAYRLLEPVAEALDALTSKQ